MAHKLMGNDWRSLIMADDGPDMTFIDDGFIDIVEISDAGQITSAKRRKDSAETPLRGEADADSEQRPRLNFLRNTNGGRPHYRGRLVLDEGTGANRIRIILGRVFRDRNDRQQGEDTWVAVKKG
jgi:hypothetical protein